MRSLAPDRRLFFCPLPTAPRGRTARQCRPARSLEANRDRSTGAEAPSLAPHNRIALFGLEVPFLNCLPSLVRLSLVHAHQDGAARSERLPTVHLWCCSTTRRPSSCAQRRKCCAGWPRPGGSRSPRPMPALVNALRTPPPPSLPGKIDFAHDRCRIGCR